MPLGGPSVSNLITQVAHQTSTWPPVLNLTHASLKSVCNADPLTILLTRDRINTHVDVAISFYMSAFIIKELCSKNIKMS